MNKGANSIFQAHRGHLSGGALATFSVLQGGDLAAEGRHQQIPEIHCGARDGEDVANARHTGRLVERWYQKVIETSAHPLNEILILPRFFFNALEYGTGIPIGFQVSSGI